MIKNVIMSTILMSTLWSNDVTNNKFLVIDKPTYDRIEKLNILNDGIDTDYIIFSKLIDDKTMQTVYPEIFAYNGKKCYSIQNVYLHNKKNKEFNLNKEVEKLRLLNILHNSKNKYDVNNNLNIQTIQAVGILCDNTLHIRNKNYKVSDRINNYYIKSINTKFSNVILGETHE